MVSTGELSVMAGLFVLLFPEGRIPLVHGRTAALRQLVLQAPAPVVASMLGYHDETTTKVAADAGSPWTRYAPGGHGRTQTRRLANPPVQHLQENSGE